MRTKVQLKKAYGKATFARVKHVRYLSWEDAFDVEFEDGLCFLEPHAAIRKANRISGRAVPVTVEADHELGSHFTVTYDTGEKAEVSWSFVREMPPRRSQCAVESTGERNLMKPQKVAEVPAGYGKASKSRNRSRFA